MNKLNPIQNTIKSHIIINLLLSAYHNEKVGSISEIVFDERKDAWLDENDIDEDNMSDEETKEFDKMVKEFDEDLYYDAEKEMFYNRQDNIDMCGWDDLLPSEKISVLETLKKHIGEFFDELIEME